MSLRTKAEATTRPKSECIFSSAFYLTGFGSTIKVGDDLHCDDSIGFFLYVKMTRM